MTADATVRQVLTWAGGDGTRPPPHGPLVGVGALADPTQATATLLAELTCRAAARLGAGNPPFGDRSGIGVGALLLAAAIGGRAESGPAQLLATAVDPPLRAGAPSWADALGRHAVVAPALAHLVPAPVNDPDPDAGPTEPEPLAETLLRGSPLTAVLQRPSAAATTAGATGAEVAIARDLLGRPHGRAVLQDAFCAFPADAATLTWRTELLTRWLTEQPEVVLDTYVAARLRHGPRWDTAVTAARRALGGRSAPDPLALATLRFWLPLARLRRNHPELLRARPLMTGHHEVLRIVEGRHQRSIAGAA